MSSKKKNKKKTEITARVRSFQGMESLLLRKIFCENICFLQSLIEILEAVLSRS